MLSDGITHDATHPNRRQHGAGVAVLDENDTNGEKARRFPHTSEETPSRKSETAHYGSWKKDATHAHDIRQHRRHATRYKAV